MLIIGFVLQLFLVFARTKSSDSDGGDITCFLVDRAETDSETMKFSPPHNLAGYRYRQAATRPARQ